MKSCMFAADLYFTLHVLYKYLEVLKPKPNTTVHVNSEKVKKNAAPEQDSFIPAQYYLNTHITYTHVPPVLNIIYNLCELLISVLNI